MFPENRLNFFVDWSKITIIPRSKHGLASETFLILLAAPNVTASNVEPTISCKIGSMIKVLFARKHKYDCPMRSLDKKTLFAAPSRCFLVMGSVQRWSKQRLITSSSHVFTNPESTNLLKIFTIFFSFVRWLQSVFFYDNKQLYRHFSF